eukprot:COSAG01_NODE_3622_length_5858_cov_1194.967187_1_plen_83_part_00
MPLHDNFINPTPANVTPPIGVQIRDTPFLLPGPPNPHSTSTKKILSLSEFGYEGGGIPTVNVRGGRSCDSQSGYDPEFHRSL